MGLAALLQRKLGPQPGHGSEKRRRGEFNDSRATARIDIDELAALKTKNTRTARRKLRKLGPEASRLLSSRAIEEATMKVQESEDEDADGDAECGEEGAYDKLLMSLASGSSAIAEAYNQRRREFAGDSDESDTEDDDEDGKDEDEDELETGDGDAAARGGSEDVVDDDDVDDDDDDDDDEFDPDEVDAEVDEPKQIGIPANNSSLDLCREETTNDSYSCHFEKQLNDLELAALSAATSTARSFTAVPEALQAWAPWATVQESSLSNEIHSLSAIAAAVPKGLRGFGVKERLATRWQEVHRPVQNEPPPPPPPSAGNAEFVSDKQKALFAMLNSYVDVFHPDRPYPTSFGAPDPELDAVLLHILNHISRSADTIKRNNDHLKQPAPSSTGGVEARAADDIPRDQGFTRPKILVLLPMRNAALHFVLRLLTLAMRETRTDSIQNKKRFLEEFGDDEEGADAEDGGLSDRARTALARKPAQHRALFHGNVDDHFRMGIKLTRGAAKLYADFFQSDIIVASALGMATKLEESTKKDGGSVDFLSSIEMLVIDRADVLLMQNWSHVRTVLGSLNRLPTEQRDVDIMRVREWCLAGQARYYRQTIMMSSFASAEMNALLARGCVNHSGAVRLLPSPRGVLAQVIPHCRQFFEPLPALPSPSSATQTTDADSRFEHFKTKLWPRVREAARGGGQLIYIPSYFDFVRVRNFLRAESASFVGLCEYNERSDMARARAYFADGRRRVLLYTERAQFYNRHRIRGVKDILFYQLPEHPQFYLELVNLLEEDAAGGHQGADMMATAVVIYSRFDALRLERVVGAERAGTMLKRGKKGTAEGTFLFC